MQDSDEPQKETTESLGQDLGPQSQDLSYTVQDNPMFSTDGAAESGAAPDTKEKTRSGGGGVRFQAAPMLARADHVESSSSESDYEGHQRALFRELLNRIRFKVGRSS